MPQFEFWLGNEDTDRLFAIKAALVKKIWLEMNLHENFRRKNYISVIHHHQNLMKNKGSEYS